jgi:hypothetical protein
MKIPLIAWASLLSAAFILPSSFAADKIEQQKEPVAAKTPKAKPYTLKTCAVSDEKLGGDMGEPYTFTYKDREIKLCCKDCRKDFDKDPAKYIKKIETAEKKAKK